MAIGSQRLSVLVRVRDAAQLDTFPVPLASRRSPHLNETERKHAAEERGIRELFVVVSSPFGADRFTKFLLGPLYWAGVLPDAQHVRKFAGEPLCESALSLSQTAC